MSGKRQKAERAKQRLAVVRELAERFIANLRAILVRRRGHLPRSPCDSCAFNRSTDSWRGFDATAMELEKAIARGQPFYCHHDLPKDSTGAWQALPDRSQMTTCAGFEAIKGDPATRLAFGRAATATALRQLKRLVKR